MTIKLNMADVLFPLKSVLLNSYPLRITSLIITYTSHQISVLTEDCLEKLRTESGLCSMFFSVSAITEEVRKSLKPSFFTATLLLPPILTLLF
jgi:hypothetical protein